MSLSIKYYFNDGNTKTTDKKTIYNNFCNFFTNVGKKLQHNITRIGDWFPWRYHHQINAQYNFKFKPVTQSSVRKILKKLKRSSAAGYDDIPPSLVKDSAEVITPHLSYLINLFLENASFPSCEKVAKVTPVHKGDSKSEYDNYRPILVLPVFSKVFEKIVH